MSSLKVENKCSHLYEQQVEKLSNPLVDIFKMQLSLQQNLAKTGRAIDYNNADFKTRVNEITVQWRNMNLEMAELLERLPFKEWKTYNEDALKDFKDTESKLETWYEYIDVFHFFINVGLCLGITGDAVEHLYVTKNKENFDRQKRGY